LTHSRYDVLLYFNAKYLHAIGPNRATRRFQIRAIHQPLNQPVNFNIALGAILKWFLASHVSLIFKASMTTPTTHGCLALLWLNRTSYVICS